MIYTIDEKHVNLSLSEFKMIKDKKYIKCKSCNGFGFTIFYHTQPKSIQQERQHCSSCDGLGYIKMTWTEEIIHGRKI